MPKTYRKIQQWDRWLGHFPGQSVLSAEKKFLPHLLAQYYGIQALIIGTAAPTRIIEIERHT